jgi:polysaccharide export outer membrane protein
MKKYLLLLIALAFLTACLSSKELTYLQGVPMSNLELKRVNNIPYKLQIDDILNITITSKNVEIVAVFQKGNNGVSGDGLPYFSDYSIDNYGNIRVPTLGEFKVLGLTEIAVRRKIEKKIREKYIREDESLFVSAKLSGIKYTILGEVANPQTTTLFQNRVSVIDAIANSGDITEVGDRKSIEIIRRSIGGTEKFIVDLTDINILNSETFYIRPNDIINVKPLKEKSWGTGTTGFQTLSSIVSIVSLLATTIILAKNL